MPSKEQVVAATRFGLGAAQMDYLAMGDDPKAWLHSQTNPGDESLLPDKFATPQEFFEVVWGEERPTSMAPFGFDPKKTYEAELHARCRFGASTPMPFRERLVRFFSNHFAVADRDGTLGTIGAFEREVIRPRIMGRFEDMLVASSAHPIMICYLENNMSRGPNSTKGKAGGFGLNENLAREILELHSLGVDGGYTQTDIVELAKAISGWTFNERYAGYRPFFAPRFDSSSHEPGAVTVLDKTYRAGGQEQGEAILRDLARHPATARHIATKLARHFHSDTPPPSLIARLETTYTYTGGSISALAKTLIEAPECWTLERPKVKSTDDYWVSIMRAGHPLELEQWRMNWAYHSMNQPIWAAPSPAGWPDNNATWGAPGHLRQRMYASLSITFDYIDRIDDEIASFGEKLYGPYLDNIVREQIKSLPHRSEQMVVLLMSPAFQRR